MKKHRQIVLRVWPYLSCILAGLILFLVGIRLAENFKGLFLNIAAAFFVIPFLYLIYELARKASQKKLNKELFDYAKMQIDRELMSIVNQLMKLVYPYEQQDFSFHGIQHFLSKNNEEIQNLIETSQYLGFQVLKNWSISERNLHAILQNPFILPRLEDQQTISIIKLLKALRSFEAFQKNAAQLYMNTERKSEGYKIKGSKEMSSKNLEYPDRYLLLKHLSDDNYRVTDFGDFEPYRLDNLLNVYKISHKYVKAYTEDISDIIKQINAWIDLTGKEFLLDTKMFRLGLKATREQELQKKAIRI